MDIRNCRSCGKIFTYAVGPIICPACREAAEAKFQECKKYVSEHRGITITELAEACDVEPNMIRQWLREERLQFSEDSLIGLECEKCGVSIVTGRFCQKCKNEMARGLNSAFAPAPAAVPEPASKNAGTKMRFIDNK